MNGSRDVQVLKILGVDPEVWIHDVSVMRRKIVLCSTVKFYLNTQK